MLIHKMYTLMAEELELDDLYGPFQLKYSTGFSFCSSYKQEFQKLLE